jgi:hypothetical protein
MGTHADKERSSHIHERTLLRTLTPAFDESFTRDNSAVTFAMFGGRAVLMQRYDDRAGACG